MEKTDIEKLAGGIAAMMAARTYEDNKLFLSRLLPKMDQTSLEYIKLAFGLTALEMDETLSRAVTVDLEQLKPFVLQFLVAENEQGRFYTQEQLNTALATHNILTRSTELHEAMTWADQQRRKK